MAAQTEDVSVVANGPLARFGHDLWLTILAALGRLEGVESTSYSWRCSLDPEPTNPASGLAASVHLLCHNPAVNLFQFSSDDSSPLYANPARVQWFPRRRKWKWPADYRSCMGWVFTFTILTSLANIARAILHCPHQKLRSNSFGGVEVPPIVRAGWVRREPIWCVRSTTQKSSRTTSPGREYAKSGVCSGGKRS